MIGISFLTYYLNYQELTNLYFPFFKDLVINLGWFFIPFSVFIIVGASNAVNLTDGLDGLAIMPSVMVAAGMGIIAYISGNAILSDYLNVPYLFYSTEIILAL